MGHTRVIRTYSESDWRDPAIRRKAFVDARKQAEDIKGEVIIKISYGRHKAKVASVRWYPERGTHTHYR